MTDISLRILLSAQSTVDKVLANVGDQILKMAGQFKPLLIGAGVAGAAIIGIGIAAVNAAGPFQTAMLSLVAHAGLAQSQVQNVTDALLAMGPAVGRSPTELADAMYPILSAFSNITDQSAKTQLALTTLKLSFEAVAGTTTDGTAVANAAVGTFNALGLATNNAALNASRMKDLMDIMDLTVQQGNMQWDAYKNVISKLAVSIQGTGVSFTEASAALATMTNEGFSAQKAQTYLSNTFTTLAIKTDAIAKHAKALKISFNESKYASMDWADKLKYLNQITDGNKQKLLALMGGNSTALKTFNALTTGSKAYASSLQALGHAHGALKTSFDTASQGFQFAMSQAGAAVQALLIKIGLVLLPVLTKLVQAVVPIVSWIMNFTGAISQNQTAMDAIKAVLLAVAGIITGVLINALALWAAAMIPVMVETLATIGPILLLGLVAAGVIFGIMQAIKHWGAIVTWLGNVWTTISTHIGEAFNWLGTTIHNIIFGIISWFQNLSGGFKALLAVALIVFAPIVALILGVILVVTHWGQIMAWFGSVFSSIGTQIHSIIDQIGRKFSDLGTFVQGVWQGIVGAVKSAINFIIGIINGFIGGIDNIHISAGPIQIGFNIPKIPYLASGGYIEAPGLAMVHRGETVVPAKASSLGGGAGGGTTVNFGTVNFYGAPSRQMAQDFLQYLSRELRRSGTLITWTSGGSAP